MKNSKKIIFGALLAIFAFSNNITAQSKYAGTKTLEVYEEEFEKDGKVKKYKVLEVKYDQNGNIIEEIEYDNGKVSDKFEYTYDKDGKKISALKTESDGKQERFEYKYDDKNRRIEKSEYSMKGRLKKRKTYIYK